jgi:tetratricopeptide (TPR) repeat protein
MRWKEDWSRTNTSFTRTLWTSPDSNFAEMEQKLETLFAGAEIYPDLSGSLSYTTKQLLHKRDWNGATHSAEITLELYPESEKATAIYAVSLLHNGSDDQIESYLNQSVSKNPEGMAAPDGIASLAYDLANSGNMEEAIRLFSIGTRIYPREPDLYEELGELYFQKGDKEKAIDAFKEH